MTNSTDSEDPEAVLRALWTAEGVTPERQAEVLAEVRAAAQPAAIAATMARVFNQPAPYAEELTPTGQQFVFPGCERAGRPDRPQIRQLSLFA